MCLKAQLISKMCISLRVHFCKQGYIGAEIFGYGTHKQIQIVQFEMIMLFTASLKFTGAHVDPCKTSLHLPCAITAGWLFWEKINA